jgi:hypothetical protein
LASRFPIDDLPEPSPTSQDATFEVVGDQWTGKPSAAYPRAAAAYSPPFDCAAPGLGSSVTAMKRAIIALIWSGASNWQKCPDPTVRPKLNCGSSSRSRAMSERGDGSSAAM